MTVFIIYCSPHSVGPSIALSNIRPAYTSSARPILPPPGPACFSTLHRPENSGKLLHRLDFPFTLISPPGLPFQPPAEPSNVQSNVPPFNLAPPPIHAPSLRRDWSPIQRYAIEKMLKLHNSNAVVPQYCPQIAERVDEYLYCRQWLHRTQAINIPGTG